MILCQDEITIRTGFSVKFRFTGPKGFDGYHVYEIVSGTKHLSVLRHTVKMNTHWPALLSWPLIFGPMHDSLIEDSFTVAEVSLGLAPEMRAWYGRVKIIRRAVSGGKAGPQVMP